MDNKIHKNQTYIESKQDKNTPEQWNTPINEEKPKSQAGIFLTSKRTVRSINKRLKHQAIILRQRRV